jgi:uncharacterized protein
MKKYIALVGLMLACIAGEAQNNNSLLWRIDSKTGGKPSYVFGTIHMARKDFVNYTDSVYTAIQQTKKFFNEVDFLNTKMSDSKEMMDFLVEKGMQFQEVIKTDPWKKLVGRINRQYGTTIAPDDLDAFIEFGQKHTTTMYDMEPGVPVPDIALANHARALGKPTGGIETHLIQFKLIFDLLDARLKDTTMNFEDDAVMMQALKKFYISESLDSINHHIVQFINPTYRKLLFDDRNITMADSIEMQIQKQTGFFAIGAGHLGGSTGVITMLRKKGFTVSPVHSSNKMSILVINAMLEQARKKPAMDLETETRGVKDEIQEGIKDEAMPEPPPPQEKLKVTEEKKTKPKTKVKSNN